MLADVSRQVILVGGDINGAGQGVFPSIELRVENVLNLGSQSIELYPLEAVFL